MTILLSKVNQLGDNVVFLPVVQALRQALPEAKLIVATSPVAATLYRRCVDRCEVIEYPTTNFNGAWKHPIQLLKLMREWSSFRPDAVLLGDDQGNVSHLLGAASRAPIRVGPLIDTLRLGGMLTHRMQLDLGSLVAVQNWRLMLALLKKMHVGHALPESPPQPDLSGIAKTVSRKGIVIHAGASRAYKRWPMERYVALANQLAADGYVVTWIDQGEQIELSGTICRFKIGLLEDFIQLLANTALFIGNNSGPMNLASALGTPGIIFNGPSTPNWSPAWHQDRFELLADPALSCQPCDKLTHPVNACQNKVEPMACMNRWSVERVSGIATRMIKQHA